MSYRIISIDVNGAVTNWGETAAPFTIIRYFADSFDLNGEDEFFLMDVTHEKLYPLKQVIKLLKEKGDL